MDWISLKDELPKNKCIAIGYQDEIIIGYISGDVVLSFVGRLGTGFICTNEHETLTNVTHWMHLPEPPK